MHEPVQLAAGKCPLEMGRISVVVQTQAYLHNVQLGHSKSNAQVRAALQWDQPCKEASCLMHEEQPIGNNSFGKAPQMAGS